MKHLAFVAALTIFLVLQIRLFFAHDTASPFRDTDGFQYIELAETGGRDPFHGPLFPGLIGAVAQTGLTPYASAKLISRIAGLTVLVMSWMVFRRLTSPAIAGVAVLLTVSIAPFLELGHAIMSDMLAAALLWMVFAAVTISNRGEQERWWSTLATGAIVGTAIGLAYLTRYGSLIFLIVPVLALFRPGLSWKQRTIFASGTAASFLVAAGPHLLLVIQNPHVNLFGENHYNVALPVLTGSMDYTQFGRIPVNSVFDIIRMAPEAFVRNWGNNLAGVPSLIGDWFGELRIFLLAGLPLWWFQRNFNRLLLVFGLGAHLALTGIAWLDHRMLLLLMPIGGLLAAEALGLFARCLLPWKRVARFRPAFVMVGAALVVVSQMPSALRTFHRLQDPRLEYEAATAWLSQQGVTPATPVATSEPLIAVRAHASPFDLLRFSGQFDRLLPQLIGGYLILDQKAMRDVPELQMVYRSALDDLPSGLTEVFLYEQPRLVIYRVDGPVALPSVRMAQMRRVRR